MEKFILLLCHDRSGSNLMRGILTGHPDIYIVPPLPIYERLYSVIDKYGDLEDDLNYDQLLRDIVALAAVNHFPLAYPVMFRDLCHESRGRARSLGQACKACFEVIAKKSGREVGGIKSGVQPDKLESFISTTEFTHAIFQYRDPRDVCLSAVKAARSGVPPRQFMGHWLEWHRNARHVLQKVFPGPVQEVRYERLISRPNEMLDSVWDFLGVRHCSEALSFFRGDEQLAAAEVSYMWENLAKPVMSSNSEKFYEEWNAATIRELEAILGNGLEEFGYAPADPMRFKHEDMKPAPRDLNAKDKALTSKQDQVFQSIIDRLKLDIEMLG